MSAKKELIRLIVKTLNQELESLASSAKAAHEAATHEESKAEDAHDTRGLEASYLAGAQMARIEALRKTISILQHSEFKDIQPGGAIESGALIELESGGKRSLCFLVSQGGGISLPFQGKSVQVITPQSPLGEALLGRSVGEEVEVEAQKGIREYEIIKVE
jgi:transcription elongation GreA/GreB family factor